MFLDVVRLLGVGCNLCVLIRVTLRTSFCILDKLEANFSLRFSKIILFASGILRIVRGLGAGRIWRGMYEDRINRRGVGVLLRLLGMTFI